MKKIWIDGYEANVSQRLGSGQVAFHLLKYIESIDKTNDYTILLPTPPLSDLPKERLGWRYKILKPKPLWTRIALPLALFSTKDKPDVFFSPTHYGPLFVPSGIKKVLSIFDLAFVHFPQMFKKSDLYKLVNWTKSSVEKTDHIVTISQFSKKDIVNTYKYPKDKITVCYPGYMNEVYRPIKDKEKINKVLEKYGIDGEYIVFLGTVQPRKNLILLMDAVARIPKLKLVVIGKINTQGGGQGAWLAEETLAKPKSLGIEDRVIFTGFMPDEDTPFVFAGTEAFVLPSLYEGFGIPVVDAMACGIPVIVSNVSSLPEVVGDAGLLVDPKSVTQIEQAIRLISTDKKLRDRLSKKALLQSKNFSWKKMAKDVIKVLENV